MQSSITLLTVIVLVGVVALGCGAPEEKQGEEAWKTATQVARDAQNAEGDPGGSAPYSVTFAVKDNSPPEDLLGRMTITGNVPDFTTRTKIMARATGLENFGLGTVKDKMERRPGAPDGWLDANRAIARAFSNIRDGEATIVDNQVKISGTLLEGTSAESVIEAIKEEMPNSYTLTAEL